MSYGGRGRNWHPNFVEYVSEIVSHPNYEGMPAVYKADGDVDWTIPSNRKTGSQNWNGNELRRDWWRQKAVNFGIPLVGFWLRDAARINHPMGEKPCQTCGRVMQLAYVYPNKNLRNKLERRFPELLINWEDFPTIFDLLDSATEEFGDVRAVREISKILGIQLKDESSVIELAGRIQSDLVDLDAGPLSPGAMSNSPDRLDGFHTYNLCCRSNQDTGRSSQNLSKYIVDRRAYEHWSEGDWALADQVMRKMPIGYCRGPALCAAKKYKVQLTADHIGPISLGFRHSPIFNALCQTCNSAKNNRMSFEDIQQLIELEGLGNIVVSQQATKLWAHCSVLVSTDKDALLLSRIMRINQEMYLRVLSTVANSKNPILLLPRLQLELAANRIVNIDFDQDSLELVSYDIEARQLNFAEKRVERVIRIAFDSIFNRNSENRNVHLVEDYELDSFDSGLLQVTNQTQLPDSLLGINQWIIDLRRDSNANSMGLGDLDFSTISALVQKSSQQVDEQILNIMEIVQGKLIERFLAGDHRDIRPPSNTH